jgi:hypothetical protein
MAQNQMIAEDAEVWRLFFEGIADRDSLSHADRQRLDPMIGIQIQGMHQRFESHAKGIGTEAAWH